MRRFLKTRGVGLAITATAVIALMPEPAWAFNAMPGPGKSFTIKSVDIISSFIAKAGPAMVVIAAPTARTAVVMAFRNMLIPPVYIFRIYNCTKSP